MVNNPLYSATLKEDLKTIPSISLVMNFNDIFGPNGIYSNPNGEGVAWERPGSFEIIYPDGSDGYQVNAGVRMYGGVGRFEQFRKHSFRLLFKEQYGDTKLRFPLFPDSDLDKFDTIILRAGFNNSYVISQGEAQRAEYIRDQFIRDSQLAMGDPSAWHVHAPVHQWNLLGPVQSDRAPDASFAAENIGGEKEDWTR